MLSLCWCNCLNVLPRNAESGAHLFLINVIFANEAEATKKEDDEDGGNHGIMPVVGTG